MKNPNSIVIKLNGGTTEGTNMFTYDGSSSKSINITAASLGIPTSGLYLPLSGGTMTGNIEYITTPGGGLPYAGSFEKYTDFKFTANMKSFIGSYYDGNGWYSIISIRHRNGESDGTGYGLIIKADLTGPNIEHLRFIRNYGPDKWTGEIMILDQYGGNLDGHIIGTTSARYFAGDSSFNSGWIELSSAAPYIDFHYNNSTADFTSRIIEDASGQLAINGVHFSSNNIYSPGLIYADGVIQSNSEYLSTRPDGSGWTFGANTGTGDPNVFGFYHNNSKNVAFRVTSSGVTYAKNTYISEYPDGFRIVYGKYGFILRNDGASTYFLLTNANDPYGVFNSLRPLYIDNSTGMVNFDEGIKISDTIQFVDYSSLNSGTYTYRMPIASASGDTNQIGYISSRSGSIAICGKFGSSSFDTKTINVTSSDIRLKGNIKDSTVEALPFINKIKMRQFDWIEEDNRHQDIGFVADELEELDPNLSSGGGYTEDGFRDLKSVNTFYLDGYIVKSIQELSKENGSLKDEIKEMKKIIEELQSKIN